MRHWRWRLSELSRKEISKVAPREHRLRSTWRYFDAIFNFPFIRQNTLFSSRGVSEKGEVIFFPIIFWHKSRFNAQSSSSAPSSPRTFLLFILSNSTFYTLEQRAELHAVTVEPCTLQSHDWFYFSLTRPSSFKPLKTTKLDLGTFLWHLSIIPMLNFKIIVSSLFHSIVFNEMVLRRKEECETTWFAGPTLKMTLSSRTYIPCYTNESLSEIIVWINLIKIYIVHSVRYGHEVRSAPRSWWGEICATFVGDLNFPCVLWRAIVEVRESRARRRRRVTWRKIKIKKK